MNSKDNIRIAIKKQKACVDAEEKKYAEVLVFNKVHSLDEWNTSKNILFYNSLPDELQTTRQLEDNNHDKNIFLPRVNGSTLDILRYDADNMHIGAFNINEPSGHNTTDIEAIDLVIVPGVAFDKNGNRLGRGKGYYDSLLSNCRAIKIGVCYDFQLLDNIPAENHDVKMDIIITPKYLIRIK